MGAVKKIKEAIYAILLIAFWIAVIALPATIGIYIDKSKEPVYKDYVVVDKMMGYSYHKNNQHQVLSFIIKDVESGELESKDVSKVMHYKVNVGDHVRFEDESKKSFVLGTIGIFLSGIFAIILMIIAHDDFFMNN